LGSQPCEPESIGAVVAQFDTGNGGWARKSLLKLAVHYPVRPTLG
jgi:hypothetical protein